MRKTPLIRAVWTGQSFIPDGNHATAVAHDLLGEGQVVNLDVDPDRTQRNHNHFFACVHTAWMNLPEGIKDAPFAVTADTLRKQALIATGHCDTDMITVGTHERAEKVAAFASRLATRLHGYAITQINGSMVYCHTPHSQSLKEMGGERFKRSKQDVLEHLAGLLGVTSDELAQMGREEAA